MMQSSINGGGNFFLFSSDNVFNIYKLLDSERAQVYGRYFNLYDTTIVVKMEEIITQVCLFCFDFFLFFAQRRPRNSLRKVLKFASYLPFADPLGFGEA